MAGAKDESKNDILHMGIPNKENSFCANIQKCFIKLTKINFPQGVPNITNGSSYSRINHKCFVKLEKVESALWENITASSVLKIRQGRYLSVDEKINLTGDNDTSFLLKNYSTSSVLKEFKEEYCSSDESIEVPCPQMSPSLEVLPSSNAINNSFGNKDRIEETDVDSVNNDSADEMLFNPFPGLFFLKHSNKPNLSTRGVDCARLKFMESKYVRQWSNSNFSVSCSSDDGSEKERKIPTKTLINKVSKISPKISFPSTPKQLKTHMSNITPKTIGSPWFAVDGFSPDKQSTDTDESCFKVNKFNTIQQDLTSKQKIFKSASKKKWTSIKARSGTPIANTCNIPSKDYSHNKLPISIYCKSQRNSFRKAYLEKRRRPSELTQYRNFILNITNTNRKKRERKIHNIGSFYSQKYEPLESIGVEEPLQKCISSKEDGRGEQSTLNHKPYIKGIVRKSCRKEKGKSKQSSKQSSNELGIEMLLHCIAAKEVVIKRRQIECFVCIEKLAWEFI